MSDQETTSITERLLSEALDLVVRARHLDAIDRRQAHLGISSNPTEWVESGVFDKHVERNNIENPHAPIATRSLTIPVWLTDQYERDLHDWEGRARNHLQKLHWTTP